ncbi:3-carboxy-cis,cis-muconate cycloisomerase [Nitrospirillum pindoramense]|uniref:3-carboxy-cis,cis-muconate cycloisomerase n=1 Tax=Nitrospirillum amazonense TaxID=28077 RepID=A0A560H2A5_9PROT|nr:3-carboxy-cis,cis-muconate cycloisomerase [Nitrospirillum amazonense]TWB39750.1 3-carboxy-cis,cis-muconate cycloisomerase [Nitrospirillum amazonense]
MPGMLDPLFRGSPVDAVFTDAATVQGMLDVEAALARAETGLGVIPPGADSAIAAQCQAGHFDLDALARSAAKAGNTAIPLVKALTARVAAADRDASRFVHWGATSQDVMDTGLVLQIRQAVALVDHDLGALEGHLARLAERHAETPLAARTWMQQALPTTFGLKAAGWMAAVARVRRAVAAAGHDCRVVQFGGAAGTLAALGDRGLEVAAALAHELDLALPDLPWHGHRDRLVALGAALGLVAGVLGKMARDLSLLMQTEVGEAFEPAEVGKGGSSAMPHKRNPVACAVALSAANRVPPLVATLFAAMPQEHERGLGGWHAEWETLPEIFRLVGGSLRVMVDTMAGLEVDAGRMRANLDITHGLLMSESVVMALGEALGRGPAHSLVEKASRQAVAEGRSLGEVLVALPEVTTHLSPEQLAAALDPAHYLGMAPHFVARALAARTPSRDV